MPARGLSELYAALLLFAVSAAITPLILSYVRQVGQGEPGGRPVLVVRVNETHAVCYTATAWSPAETLKITDFTYYIYASDIDNDGLLDPSPGSFNDTVPPGYYVLVSPPIVCIG